MCYTSAQHNLLTSNLKRIDFGYMLFYPRSHNNNIIRETTIFIVVFCYRFHNYAKISLR